MTAAREPRLWKGLDTSRPPHFLGYEQSERMLAALLGRAAQWQPDAVVGIARGGLIPATMAATMLALPLGYIACQRGARRANWIGPPLGERVLLVDDGCSTGHTLATVRTALCDEGRACLTLAIVHDPDCSDYTPDLSHPMRELWRFPWERGEATPRARASRVQRSETDGPQADLAREAPFVGVDFDVLARRRDQRDPLAGLPLVTADRAAIVGVFAAGERGRAEAFLARSGHGRLRLECRPDSVPDNPGSLARYKATAATRWGCTHFIEADPAQSILLAATAPHLLVIWWSAGEDKGYLIGAAGAR
jgi:hypoxanthine phosphoribosyltransferase